MKVEFSALTHAGSIREKNEDSFLAIKIDDNKFLFTVADGMGGYEKGDVASKIAVEETKKFFKTGFNSFNEDIKKLFFTVNRKIIDYSKKNLIKKIGTTLTILYIENDKFFIAHIGDSKIYRISNKLEQLTKDHSFVEMLLENKLITRDEALNHPKRNVLSQALGIKEEISPQIEGPYFLNDNERFIVSSDGLPSALNEKEIEKVVKKRRKSREITKELIRKSLKNGAPDNVTVISILCNKKNGKNKLKTLCLIFLAFIFFLIIFNFRNFLYYVNQNKEEIKRKSFYLHEKSIENIELIKIGKVNKFSFFGDTLYFLSDSRAYRFLPERKSKLKGKLKSLFRKYEPVKTSFLPSFYSKNRLYILKNNRLRIFKKNANSIVFFVSEDGLIFELNNKTLKIKNIFKNKSSYYLFNDVEKIFIFRNTFVLKRDNYFLLSIKDKDISSLEPVFIEKKMDDSLIYVILYKSETIVFYPSYLKKENRKFVFSYKNSPLSFVSLYFSYSGKFFVGVDEKKNIYFGDTEKWLEKN